MSTDGLYLVVARGKDAGSRVRLEEEPRLVGRGRSADLVLLDRRISRTHLRVRRDGTGAHVETCEGATPFMLSGSPKAAAHLDVGDTILLGDTALVVTRITEASEEARSTDVGVLMTGLAADVRGLAAAMDLVQALDEAQDDDSVRTALAGWGKRHLAAVDANVLAGDGVDAGLREAATTGWSVVERAGAESGVTILAAPAGSAEPSTWVSFTCPVAPKSVTDTTRRLVAIAGRICASTLARVHALAASREEQDLFRRASLGSARSFLGHSPAAREVSKLAARLASSDVVVLLEGETGVGKTFLARLLHESGPRAKASLRVLNCAAIPETLLESELFGHERGAFTSAATMKQGALEAAGSGTVLLDEIGELPLASQAKLLRVLEEKRFERLGSNRAIPLAARVITATNRDLAEMVTAGTFRADLFYRIAVVKLRIPPLRDRGDDLLLLAERMLADLVPSAGRRVRGFSPEAMEVMRRYPWPGNVRELRNAIERALAVGEAPYIEPGDLPETVHGAPPAQPSDESLVRLPAKLEWLESRAIEAAMHAAGGNQRKAAVLLGINRVTLNRKLRAEGESGGEER